MKRFYLLLSALALCIILHAGERETITPRPVTGLAKHTTAWQDLQRAIRIVRSEAPAGGHLTLMGVPYC